MNLPNKLTLSRMILVPVFMIFASMTQLGTDNFNASWYLAAGIVFAIASFTDYLDGHLARKWHMVTDFGKFADPLADKLLTTVAFIYMMRDGVCSPVVLCIILAREFAVSIIFYFFGVSLTYGHTMIGNLDVWLISHWLCWLVAAATAISGIKYLWDNRSFINTAK